MGGEAILVGQGSRYDWKSIRLASVRTGFGGDINNGCGGDSLQEFDWLCEIKHCGCARYDAAFVGGEIDLSEFAIVGAYLQWSSKLLHERMTDKHSVSHENR